MKAARVILIVGIVSVVAVIVLFRLRRPNALPQLHSRPTFDSLVNVHGSAKKVLRVCGRSFPNVRGAPPYYETVENSDFLIFAYSPSEDQKVLVLVNTNTCKFYEIDAENVRFGERIGYWTATTNAIGDTAVLLNAHEIELRSESFSYNELALWRLTNTSVTVISLQQKGEKTVFELP